MNSRCAAEIAFDRSIPVISAPSAQPVGITSIPQKPPRANRPDLVGLVENFRKIADLERPGSSFVIPSPRQPVSYAFLCIRGCALVTVDWWPWQGSTGLKNIIGQIIVSRRENLR